jgi:HrpA-like RNA helicase
MYSSHTYDDELQDYQLPEMLRVGIEDLVLQILILDLGEPTIFLSKALNPPSELAMSNSLKLLETLGAVECRWQDKRPRPNQEEKVDGTTNTCGNLQVTSELTALGFHLATLPVEPRVGKMMIYGSLFGCVEPALTVAASMSARSPFMSPFDQREAADAARKKFAVEGSDHLTILNAFATWKEMKHTEGNKAVQSFLKDHFLGRMSLFQMEDLRKQFTGLLTDIGFLPKGFKLQGVNKTENANSQNMGLVKAVLCAGLYPNIIVAPRSLVGNSAAKKSDKKAGECAFQSHHKGEVYLHPSTIAFTEQKLDSRYCCYHEMVKTSKTYVRDCTTVSPFALLLFGGALEVYQTHGICSVDGWLKFRIDAKPATLIKYLRSQMERILLQKIVAPETDVAGSPEGKALIQSISILFERDAQESIVSLPPPDRSGGEFVRPWTGNDQQQENGNHRSTNNNNNNNDGPGGQGRGRGRGRGRGGRGRGARGGGRGGGGRK